MPTRGSLVTSYTYDSRGELTQSDQGGQLRKFKYDSLGRVIRQKLAEQSATLNDAGEYVGEGGTGAMWSSAAFYDNRSNLIQRVDPRGVQINYSYKIGGADDPLNRIQSISYDSLTGPHDTSKPIAPAATVGYEYMTTGDQDRLKKSTISGISTDEFTYDTEGRVTDQTRTLLTRTSYPMVTSYTYDTLNRVTEQRDPARYGLAGSPRKLIQNAFDSSDRITTLTVDGGQQAGNIVYNAADQTTSINIGAVGTNQINEQYTFDPQTGLLTNQKAVKNGTTTLLDLTYDYSRNTSLGTLNGKTGHLTKITDNLSTTNWTKTYVFDTLGRLKSATSKNSDGRVNWQQNYIFDRYGNRTNASKGRGISDDVPVDGIPSLAYSTSNNRIATTGWEYDVAGNQTRALADDQTSWLRYEYDAANRMVAIKDDSGNLIQSQQFGAGNERMALSDLVSNQTTYFIGPTEYTEYLGNGTLVWSRSLVYFGGSILSTITPNGTGGEYVEFSHPDRLGTKLITSQAGGTSYSQSTLPFGTPLNSESTISTYSKRFTSYERSARTGLDYANNRTYDSKQGRFTQADPIGMGDSSLASPQSFNLYAYCQNDPINHTDPSGLGFFSFLKKLFGWIAGALKWIAIAITVAVIVLGIVASHGTLSPFWASMMKFLTALMAKVGSIMKFAAGGLISAEGTSQLAALGLKGLWIATATAGAIASSLRDSQGPRKRNVRLSGSLLKIFVAGKKAIQDLLTNAESECAKFLKSHGFDPAAVSQNLGSSTPYDLMKSKGKDTFGLLSLKDAQSIQPNAATSDQGRTFYMRKGITSTILTHETLHRLEPGLSDVDLYKKLGGTEAEYNSAGKGSEIIDDTLAKHGCK